MHERRDGRPVAYVPRPWTWFGAVCLSMLVAVCVFASNVEYARKETVRGWLVAEQGIVRLTHPSAARVVKVVSEPGETVRRGDVIAYLSTDGLLEDGSLEAGTILEVLHEEVAEVETREAAEREQFDVDNEALAQQVRSIDKEMRALEAQQQEQAARVDRSGTTLSRIWTAYRNGAVAEIELLRRQDEYAALRQAGARLRQEKDRLRRERDELIARRQRLTTELALRLSELTSLRNELRQRITRNESARLQAIESPVDGTVATLDLVAGNTVRAQQLLATVVPNDSTLVADVYVPSRAIGLVAAGQSVRVRFDAFPQEQFGTTDGHVEAVAEYVLLPPDIPSTFGLHEASYKVRIRLERDHVSDTHAHYGLKPGMLLAAEIVLENRSLTDWLRARFDLRL